MAPANFEHRTRNVGNTRYNLRGHAPVVPLLQTTAQQRLKNTHASRVSRSWPTPHRLRRSRGLEREGMTCFRLSGIQALMHQPRFLNWIDSHNTVQPDRSIKFPCRALNEVVNDLEAQCVFGTGRLKLRSCPACIVKSFAQDYWGNVDLQPDGTPIPWPHKHAQQVAFRHLDRRLYLLTSGASNGAQQDPFEFQDRVLKACLASTDHIIAANNDWNLQYRALFHLDYEYIWRCECGANQPLPPHTVPVPMGFENLGILPDGTPDSVAAALSRVFQPEVMDSLFDCATCNETRQRTEFKRIEGAPDILRIKIANIYYPSATRNNNFITLNPMLNLTAYQAVPAHPVPLKYKLSSVLCHSGTNKAGHWTSTVCDSVGVNHINDKAVTPTNVTYLRSNPHEGRQAIILMYTRVVSRN